MQAGVWIVRGLKTIAAAMALGWAAAAGAQGTPAQKMAATAIREWPAGMISTIGSKGQWGYEEGVLLDGMAAE